MAPRSSMTSLQKPGAWTLKGCWPSRNYLALGWTSIERRYPNTPTENTCSIRQAARRVLSSGACLPDKRSNDLGPMHRSVKAAVLANSPVVAENKILIVAKHHQLLLRIGQQSSGSRGKVRLAEGISVQRHFAFFKVEDFVRHGDDSFNSEIFMIWIFNHYKVPALSGFAEVT